MAETETEKIYELLKRNVVPSLGCTDPITPALGAAIAYNEIKGALKSVELIVSNDTFKGAEGVILPGTKETGLVFAVMFGIAAGKPEKGLMLLEDFTQHQVEEAKKMAEDIPVVVTADPQKERVYIEVTVGTDKGSATVIFKGHRETPVYLAANGRVIIDRPEEERVGYGNKLEFFDGCSISRLYNFADNARVDDLRFLQAGIDMNKKVADAGIGGSYGLSTGALLDKLFVRGGCESLYFKMKSKSSAAGDVRMGGGALPVMSVFGSGNQGAVIFNGLTVLKEERGATDEALLKGLCLSCLLSGYLNRLLGEGTPFCDCAIIAAVSLSGGMAYMLGGSAREVENAAQMTFGALAGILCDGAKPNCAQKISLGVGTAAENALLSLEMGGDIPKDGILENSFEDTVKNLARIGKAIRTSVETDIVDILKNKE